MAILEELSAAIAVVTERIGPATVSVGRDRRGTGLVIADGRVLTNAHNLRDRTTQLTFADGHVDQAELLGVDRDGDLVVLSTETSGTSPAEWSDDELAAGGGGVSASRGGPGPRGPVWVVGGVKHQLLGPPGRPGRGRPPR